MVSVIEEKDKDCREVVYLFEDSIDWTEKPKPIFSSTTPIPYLYLLYLYILYSINIWNKNIVNRMYISAY